jgi:hypothetical protein
MTWALESEAMWVVPSRKLLTLLTCAGMEWAGAGLRFVVVRKRVLLPFAVTRFIDLIVGAAIGL